MWREQNGLLQEEALLNLGIKHFCSTKLYGDMSESSNIRKLLEKCNIEYKLLVTGEQVHENKLHVVTQDDLGRRISGVDGLICSFQGIPVGIFTADCVPLFIVNPAISGHRSHTATGDAVSKGCCVGLIHVGRRGLANGIIEKSLGYFRSDAKETVIALGPHICSKCYKVSDSIGKSFGSNYRNGHLDITNELKQRLLDCSILEKNIHVSKNCTFHQPNMFFSYRRGDLKKRMLSVITV